MECSCFPIQQEIFLTEDMREQFRFPIWCNIIYKYRNLFYIYNLFVYMRKRKKIMLPLRMKFRFDDVANLS